MQYIENFRLELSDKELPMKQNISEEGKQLSMLTKELEKIERMKKHVRDLFLQERIDIDEYRKMLDELDVKEKPITEKLKALSMQEKVEKEEIINPETVLKIINDLKLNWEHLDNRERVSFLHQFVKEIKAENVDGIVSIKELNFYDLDFK